MIITNPNPDSSEDVERDVEQDVDQDVEKDVNQAKANKNFAVNCDNRRPQPIQ